MVVWRRFSNVVVAVCCLSALREGIRYTVRIPIGQDNKEQANAMALSSAINSNQVMQRGLLATYVLVMWPPARAAYDVISTTLHFVCCR